MFTRQSNKNCNNLYHTPSADILIDERFSEPRCNVVNILSLMYQLILILRFIELEIDVASDANNLMIGHFNTSYLDSLATLR